MTITATRDMKPDSEVSARPILSPRFKQYNLFGFSVEHRGGSTRDDIFLASVRQGGSVVVKGHHLSVEDRCCIVYRMFLCLCLCCRGSSDYPW